MTEGKDSKSLERAQRDAEVVSEFAKDGRNRKEAKKIAGKLEDAIENNNWEKEKTISIDTSAAAEQQEQIVDDVLDEAKNNIRTVTREAEKEIPQYMQKLGDIQEQTIQTTRSIVDNHLESQKEMISTYQSMWLPFVENLNRRFWNYWFIASKAMGGAYGAGVSSFTDNVIAATRLSNTAVATNMDQVSIMLQQTKDNSKEFSRLGINVSKTNHEALNYAMNTVY